MAEKSKGLGPVPPASGNGKGIPPAPAPAPAGKGNPPAPAWKGIPPAPAAACGDCDSPEDVSDLEAFSSLETGFASEKDKINVRTAFFKTHYGKKT